jgi:multiple sugar transport system permease protein
MAAATTAPAEAAPLALERRRPPRAVRRRKRLIFVAEHSLLIVLAIMFLAPLVFILATALMSDRQALSPDLWPNPITWNFDEVFDRAPLLRYAANTFLYAGLSTIGVVVSSVPVAYALARLRWRGRDAALLLVLAMMMLPPQVTVVPLYSMFSDLHLVGTLWPVIIPNWFGDAFSIFLLRQFFLTIPEEYADAARVDGCGEFRVMVSVVSRLAKPAIAAVALFAFLYAWNDFFLPLLYTSDTPGNWPLSVGLSHFRTTHQVEWNVTMAATLLFMAPVILLFFSAQKAFVEGVTLTGVKG